MKCELLDSIRGVAQPGSAPGLGPGGRRFESCRPDKERDEVYVLVSFLFIAEVTPLSLDSSE